MKRSLAAAEAPATTVEEGKMKKAKVDAEDGGEEEEQTTGFINLDENLLFEVLKHADARTLAASACVSKLWHKTAQDERLWELICTRHWANIGCANHQLRSVVLALGGFRRLHSLYLLPLSKPHHSSSSASASASSSSLAPNKTWAPPFAPMIAKPPTRWGKDEVNLLLSLLSIRFYEKMNSGNRNR